MGNPDLVMVFNNGEVSIIINGIDYNTRKEAIDIGLLKYGEYVNEIMDIADKLEELNFEIRSINIYEIYK